MASRSASDIACLLVAALLAVGCTDGGGAAVDPFPPASTEEAPLLVAGQPLPPGVPYALEIGTHCGVGVLGAPINGTTWIADEAGGAFDWLPAAWAELLAPGDELLPTEVELSDDGTVLTVTAAGHAVLYRPATGADQVPGCA